MKRMAICIALLTAATAASAQQTPLFGMYRDAWSLLNPSAISNNYTLNKRSMTLNGAARVQWWGLPESPRTQFLNWEYADDERNSLWGAHLINDRAGKIGQTGAYARYAYRIEMGRRVTHTLNIGLSAGVVQYRARWSEIEFPDPTAVTLLNDRAISPDFSFGAFYQYNRDWYIGLSAPQGFGLRSDFGQGDPAPDWRRKPHLYGVAGVYISTPWLGNTTSFAEPSVWIKYLPNGPLNTDLNLRPQVSELIWAGAGVNMSWGARPGSTLHFETGLILGEQAQFTDGQLKIGFMFDLALSHGIRGTLGNSAEIGVGYSWR